MFCAAQIVLATFSCIVRCDTMVLICAISDRVERYKQQAWVLAGVCFVGLLEMAKAGRGMHAVVNF